MNEKRKKRKKERREKEGNQKRRKEGNQPGEKFLVITVLVMSFSVSFF
jgi:hypothetical protein